MFLPPRGLEAVSESEHQRIDTLKLFLRLPDFGVLDLTSESWIWLGVLDLTSESWIWSRSLGLGLGAWIWSRSLGPGPWSLLLVHHGLVILVRHGLVHHGIQGLVRHGLVHHHPGYTGATTDRLAHH